MAARLASRWSGDGKPSQAPHPRGFFVGGRHGNGSEGLIPICNQTYNNRSPILGIIAPKGQGGAIPKKWLAKLHRIPAPQVPRSKELQLLPPSGALAPGHRMRDGHRFRSFLAMNCQVAAVAADGTEVPYSGASGTMRQRAESLQPTFGDCTQGQDHR